MRALLGHADPRLPDAVRRRRRRLPARGPRRARRAASTRRCSRSRSRRTRRTRSATRRSRRSSMYARQLDLPIQTHLAETRGEVDERARAHRRDAARAPRSRSASTGPGVHRRSTPCTSTPTTSTLLATHRLPRRALPGVEHEARERHRAGRGAARRAASTSRSAPTAPRRNNRLDLFARDAPRRLLAKVATGDAAALPARDGAARWRRSTARARSASTTRIGSLVAGQGRRRVAVDLSRHRRCSRCFDPVSHLVNVAGREHVTDVWVGGERVVDDGALATVDEAAIARARAGVAAASSLNATRAMTHRAPTARQRRSRPSSRSSPRSRIAGGIPTSEFRPLHEINPLRLDWIERRRGRARRQARARRRLRRRHPDRGDGARAARASPASTCRRRRSASRGCTGSSRASRSTIGWSPPKRSPREIARRASTSSPAWRCSSTCPTRRRSSRACATLAQPGGDASSFSTLNRNPKSYAFAIVGAEYVLRLLPRGTHDWTRSSSRRPSSRAYARRAGLELDGAHRHDLQPARPDVYRLEPRHVASTTSRRSASRRDDAAERVAAVDAVLFDLDGTLADTARRPGAARSTACAPTRGLRAGAGRRACARTPRPARAACSAPAWA